MGEVALDRLQVGADAFLLARVEDAAGRQVIKLDLVGAWILIAFDLEETELRDRLQGQSRICMTSHLDPSATAASLPLPMPLPRKIAPGLVKMDAFGGAELRRRRQAGKVRGVSPTTRRRLDPTAPTFTIEHGASRKSGSSACILTNAGRWTGSGIGEIRRG